MMQDWRENVQDIAGLEDVEEELLVVFTELPEEDQQFLVELDLPLGVWEVGLDQGVHQKAGDALQDERKVLFPV